jgi:hypothetical protein
VDLDGGVDDLIVDDLITDRIGRMLDASHGRSGKAGTYEPLRNHHHHSHPCHLRVLRVSVVNPAAN